MPGMTLFVQPCPTCGRRSQIRVQLLGSQVRCQHCSAEFTANDPSTPDMDQALLMERVERLLGLTPDRLQVRA